MSEEKKPGGPDLTQGVQPADFTEGKLLGHVADDEVLLLQVGSEIFAIDPYCSHYHGPLAEGLAVDHTIRCPWHHACFSLRTGEATRPPALSPLGVWQVEREGETIFVRRRQGSSSSAAGRPDLPRPRCCGARALPTP